MKFKKLAVLIAVLFVIIVASFIKKAHMEADEAKQKEPPPLTAVTQEISAGFVSKILVTKGKEDAGRLVLTKNSSGDWLIETHFNAKARKSQIETILKNVSGLKGELYSDSKEVLSDYSLLDNQGYHIELQGSDRKSLAHLVVSPLRTRRTKNFVRDVNSNKVVVTDTDILTSLGLYSKDAKIDYKTFADFKVAATESPKILSLELAQPKQAPFLMTKKEDPKDKSIIWVSGSAGQETVLNTTKVNELISNILNLYAKDSVDPAGTQYGIDDKSPWIRVRLKAEEKPNEITLYLGAHSDPNKTYYLKVMPDAQVYELSEGAIDPMLNKSSESFLKPKAK